MAKDGSRSWFVLLGTVTAMFLETGMIKGLGVLLPALREQFTTYTWVIGLAISLAPGFGAVTCIAATGLQKVTSSRFVLMLFGSLSSFGLLISSMAPSVEIFSIGLLLTGFSFGAEATTLAALAVYFDKYFDISITVAHIGLSVGVMVMPLLTQYLLDIYGWRGTMLILCAFNANVVVAGALLRPISQQDIHTPQETPHNQSVSEESLTSNIISDKLNEKRSKLTETIVNTFDLKVFANFEIVSILVVGFGSGVYFTGWLIYFVPHAQNLGFSVYAASTLATVGGVGNLLGSCAFPFLTKVMSCKTMMIISQLLAFLTLAVDPVLSLGPSYYGIMSASFSLNVAYAVLLSACSKELLIVSEGDYYGVMNWGFVCYGIGSLVSGYVVGWLFDKYENYTFSFLFLSGIVFVSVLPMLTQSVCNRKKGSYRPITTEDPDAR